MENKNESKKLLTHFTITTALMGALFMGADLVQPSSESDEDVSSIPSDDYYYDFSPSEPSAVTSESYRHRKSLK